jgi:hypothetical protein
MKAFFLYRRDRRWNMHDLLKTLRLRVVATDPDNIL